VAAKGESSDEKARRVVLDKIYEADFHDFVVTPRARLTRDALATNLRSGTDAARDWQVCNYSRSACGMYQLRTSDDSLLMLTYDGHDGNRWLHVYRGAGRRIGVATDRWDGRGAVWEDKTGWD
jgi:hypothetical protein